MFLGMLLLLCLSSIYSTSELTHNLHKEFIYLFIYLFLSCVRALQFCLPDLASRVQEYLKYLENKLRLV